MMLKHNEAVKTEGHASTAGPRRLSKFKIQKISSREVEIWMYEVEIWMHEGESWMHEVEIWMYEVEIWMHEVESWVRIPVV